MSQENVEMMRKTYEAMANGEEPPMIHALDPEIELKEPESLPYGGLHKGVQAMGEMQKTFMDCWDLVVPTTEQLLDAGDYVVAMGRLRVRGRHSGKEVETPFAEIIKFRDGKIVEINPFNDTATLLGALESA